MTTLSTFTASTVSGGRKLDQVFDDEDVNLIREAKPVFRFCKGPVKVGDPDIKTRAYAAEDAGSEILICDSDLQD
jgi:hypothetical protein